MEFDQVLNQFINELQKIFPSIKIKFEIAKYTFEKPPIVMIVESGKNYEKQIMSKDEKYFLNNFTFLKDIYKQVNKENREVIWRYIQVLYLLALENSKLENSKLENSKLENQK